MSYSENILTPYVNKCMFGFCPSQTFSNLTNIITYIKDNQSSALHIDFGTVEVQISHVLP
jgi:hypothetical protein